MSWIGKLTVAIGLLLLIAGGTFALQGYGLLGPQSSFMHRNPDWIFPGLAILAIGVASTFIGFVLGFLRHR